MGAARAAGTRWRGTGRRLCRVLAFPVFLHPRASIGRARSSLVATRALCVPSAHPTHLSNGPDVPGPDDTRLQTGALARTKSCSAARGSLFVLCLAVAANSRSHGPDGWRGVRATRSGRQLGLKQWPVKCQKWQGRAVVEQRGDHGRMAPGALETISVGSLRPLWQS